MLNNNVEDGLSAAFGGKSAAEADTQSARVESHTEADSDADFDAAVANMEYVFKKKPI